MRKWEERRVRRTLMIQVLAKLHVSVSASGDVEITLYLVELQSAIDTTRVRHSTPTQLGRLCKLLLSLFRSTEVIMDILLLIIGTSSFGSTATKMMSTLCILPMRPHGWVAVKGLTGHDAVTRGILDVDMEVVAFHGHYDVEVELEIVRDALFYAEGVVRFTHVPAAHLGHCQQERGEGEEERPYSSILCLGLVRRFRFGCAVLPLVWCSMR